MPDTHATSRLRLRPPPAAWHLVEEVPLRLPFWRTYALHRDQPGSFLLDSARDHDTLGRFSFTGAAPHMRYCAWRRPRRRARGLALIQVRRPEAPQAVWESEGELFTDLQLLMDQWRPERAARRDSPLPFLGGAVGYFGYEAGGLIEALPEQARDDLGLPAAWFGLHDAVLGHCHATGRTYLSVTGRGATDRAARQAALDLRDDWLRRVRALEADPPPAWDGPPPGDSAARVPVHALFDGPGYCRLVAAAREHILAGDVFEVCLTHRLDSPFTGDPWRLYQELRRINPAPFAAYLNWPEAQVVCASPERFLRLGPDRVAESRPIKGTRPRGETPEEDERLRRELAASAKDRAENMMIVDLVRNDLGRVCKFHTVHVPELMAVEEYATVFQMVSTVRGELEEGVRPLDLVRACFPGGSMTGAPKIEAMKIIDRLEPVQRGVYSGAIGYLDYAGTLDLNIVIRTAVVKGGRAWYNVGGAVVADSDPADEYQETLVKARAMIAALGNVGVGGPPGP